MISFDATSEVAKAVKKEATRNARVNRLNPVDLERTLTDILADVARRLPLEETNRIRREKFA